MQFDSLWFLYLFLPCSLALYLITPSKLKNACLLVISTAFYAQLSLMGAAVMLLSVTADYLLSRVMERYDDNNRIRQGALAVSLAKNAGLLLFAWGDPLFQSGAPGLTVYTLTSMGYLIDVYRGDAVYEHNLIDFALFCTMFPKLFAGPFVTYSSFRSQLKRRRYTIDMVAKGTGLFTVSLAQKVLVADNLERMYTSLSSMNRGSITTLSAWLTLACAAFRVYLTIAAYCGMASGLGLIFGFRFPRSFNGPFTSSTVSGFFRRFHMSWEGFTRRYVFQALGGDSRNMLLTAFNVLFTAAVTGLWYAPRWEGAVWGLYFGVFILLEQYLFQRYIKKIPFVVAHTLTPFLCLLPFLILSEPKPKRLLTLLQAMSGLHGDAFNAQTLYILRSNWLTFLLACILASNILGFLYQYFLSEEPAPVEPRVSGEKRAKEPVLHIILRIAMLPVSAGLLFLVTLLQL